jgi:hypothetical protein
MPTLEAGVNYALQLLDKMQKEHIKSFNPSHSAVQEYAEHCDEWLKRSVWTGGCRSWYFPTTWTWR